MTAPKKRVKPFAFYLPQYHPIPENDEWWGKGFTEWRNVGKAVQNFEGHYQPHLPADLGYYDLRLREVQETQAQMAEQYGLAGFVYYHYWFNGRRLLERPMNQLLSNENIKLPFCVCWANENWTRRWDGRENHTLMRQSYEPGWEDQFFIDLLPYLKDNRYYRIDGQPLLIVYRVDHFPNPAGAARRWRELALEHGLSGLHLSAIQYLGVTDPRLYGFDSALQFPPHQCFGDEEIYRGEVGYLNQKFQGTLVHYEKVAGRAIQVKTDEYPVFRGVMPSWDNTARRQDTPHIFVGSSPERFEVWCEETARLTLADPNLPDPIFFVNAWNEWAEGCHLEPDLRHGHAALKRLQRAVLRAEATGFQEPHLTSSNLITKMQALPGDLPSPPTKHAVIPDPKPLLTRLVFRVARVAAVRSMVKTLLGPRLYGFIRDRIG
jgi:lipopolysaccharide biosynthesis protein